MSKPKNPLDRWRATDPVHRSAVFKALLQAGHRATEERRYLRLNADVIPDYELASLHAADRVEAYNDGKPKVSIRMRVSCSYVFIPIYRS